jgi:uncharacterized Fe-S cluster-containing radical SAM superfamily protein
MMMRFPFNPIERAKDVERIVMKNSKRLYHRFRAAPYYGGIATADAIGCSFLCAYCWNYSRNLNPARFDKYYSPPQVASRLLSIAQKRSFHLFRITGSEPVLGEPSLDHLVQVLQILIQEMPRAVFILETNGFFLGSRTDLIEKLNFRNLRIRVSLKGVDEQSFEAVSGIQRQFFKYPLIALKEMESQGLKAWPAVMWDLFTDDELAILTKRLAKMTIHAALEEEYLEAYPFVLENMKKRGVLEKRGHLY